MEQLRSLIIAGVCVCLAGCEAAALTALGVGASAGVSHTLSGITYRTFSEPLPKVKSASIKALNRMQIKVESASRMENGETIKAKAAGRDIAIELEALTPGATRMRVTASQGLFMDSATATEIIMQTERFL